MKRRWETLKTISKQFVIVIIIFALVLPKTTVFASEQRAEDLTRTRLEQELGTELILEPEFKELPEIEPHFFDPTMLPKLGEFATSTPEEQFVDFFLVSPEVNELTEPSAEVLAEHMRELGLYAYSESDSDSHSFAEIIYLYTEPILLFYGEETAETDAFDHQSISPMSVSDDDILSNPFNLRFSENDSVILNDGSASYRVPILNLPGRNGFDLNLSMIYNSSRSDVAINANAPDNLSRSVLHGLGAGWVLDLPYIINNVLYLPDRGSFIISGNSFLRYSLHDMTLHNDTSFTSGSLRSNRRVTFYNGTSYFFDGSRILGKVDRFGNTIRFYYENIPQFGRQLLTQIADSNNRRVTFAYNSTGAYRNIVITAPDLSTFRINMTRIPFHSDTTQNPVFTVTGVVNQVGAATTFSYSFDEFWTTNITGLLWRNNFAANLTGITYSSGAQVRYYYQPYRIFRWFNTPLVESYRVSTRLLRGNGSREYLRTTFTYNASQTTVIENTGLRTVYTFNHRHMNTHQRQYNAAGVLLSRTEKTFYRDILPATITQTEYRGNLSRTLVQSFNYNRYGQTIQTVSPMALGSAHERYRTNYTFDSRFGLVLTRTTRPDAQTTVVERNTLSADGRNIIRTQTYENNIRRTRTDFLHDGFGNVTEIRQFPNAHSADFVQTQIVFDSGTMPRTTRTTGVRDVTGALIGGNGIVERHFTYDPMWRVLSETDPNGYITRWQYDRVDRVTQVTFPNGGIETYTYNDWANTLTHRTVLGAVYTHQFDMLGNLLTITAPGGVVIRRNTYDNRMRLLETENARGASSSYRNRFGHDIFDRVKERQYFNSANLIVGRELINFSDVYDASGNMRVTTTVIGNAGAPNIVTFSQYDRFGRRTQEGTIGGRIITYTHDLAGRITREQSLGIDNTFTHSILGVTAVRNIEGRTSNSTYDGLGRLLTVSDFAGSVQRFSYDALGRLISQRTPFDRTGNTIRYAETRYFYDRNGNLIHTSNLINAPGTAQSWATTENTFRHNRLISSQTGGAAGITVAYTYDLAGNILTMRNGDAVTTYTYNNRGQLTQIRDALGQIESFTYDANGLPITRTDRNGTRFDKTYDYMGRLVRENAVRNGVVVDWRTYTFHSTGALNRQSTAGHEIIHSYDAQGRLIRQEETGGIVKTHQYNAANNVVSTRIAINGGVHVYDAYTFDTAQRVQTVRSHYVQVASYTYDANGNRIRTTLGNVVVTDYTFNLANLVTNVTNRHGNTVLSSFAYLYYLDGNVRQVTESDRIVRYTYDLARRLVREEVTPTVPTVTGVTVSPNTASVHRGTTRQFSAAITGILNPPRGVTWSIEGNNSSATTINANGLLTIAANETAASITVRARSTHTSTISGTAMVTVPEQIITNVSVSPNAATVVDGGSRQFSATVTGVPNPPQNVTWSIEGNNSSATTISANGLLRIATNETATSITVRARSTQDPGVSGTATVTRLVPTVINVNINPNLASLLPGTNRQFYSYVHGTGGPPQEVTWSVEGNRSSATIITSEGLLTVAANESADSIIVRARSIHTPAVSGISNVVVSSGYCSWCGKEKELDESWNVLLCMMWCCELCGGDVFGVEGFKMCGDCGAVLLGMSSSFGGMAGAFGESGSDDIATFAEIDNAEYMDSYINDESYFKLLSDLPELDSGYDGDTITLDETLGYADYELLSAVLSPHGGFISGTRDYSFDNRGNRIRMIVSGAETYTVTYTYDLNNRLLSTARTGSNPQTTAFTYDRNGNQLTSVTGGQTETRTYNAFNQLTGVTSPGMTATYNYRADGLRHSKTVNGVMTQHVWSRMHIVLERNASGGVLNRIDRGLNGSLLRCTRHGFYLFNARGDVVQLVNANGVVTRNYRYDAFGNEINPVANDTNPFRFAGEYFDRHRGEYYLRARHFSPRLGRDLRRQIRIGLLLIWYVTCVFNFY